MVQGESNRHSPRFTEMLFLLVSKRKKILIRLVIFGYVLNQCEMNKTCSMNRVNGPRMENWDLKISCQSTGRHKHS